MNDCKKINTFQMALQQTNSFQMADLMIFRKQHLSKFLLGICSIFTCVILTSTASAQKPLKVFILAGQSNMQGHAHLRTLDHLNMDENSAELLAEIQDSNGDAIVHSDVWISYLSSAGVKSGQLTTGFGADQEKIGPELTLGIRLQKELGEPILIIKTAWGGKSLHTDFRPPSAGPYEFSEPQIEQLKKQSLELSQARKEKAEQTGVYYRLMLEHIQETLADIKQVYPDYDAEPGFELAGFVWFQGWNDMVDRGVYPNRDQPGGYEKYTQVLKHFVRDVRKDLKSARLPFIVGVMGINGPTDEYLPDQQRYSGIHQNFRDAMADVASQEEFRGTVFNVLTEDYWDSELTSLRFRDSNLKKEAKSQTQEESLDQKSAAVLLERLRAEEFTERELQVMKNGISNQEYHYLGSAKIMTRIGDGFATALLATINVHAEK
jgi:alpha-galactosidase